MKDITIRDLIETRKYLHTTINYETSTIQERININGTVAFISNSHSLGYLNVMNFKAKCYYVNNCSTSRSSPCGVHWCKSIIYGSQIIVSISPCLGRIAEMQNQASQMKNQMMTKTDSGDRNLNSTYLLRVKRKCFGH